MAIYVIAALSLLILWGAALLPGRLRHVTGTHQIIAALALPTIGTFGGNYLVFAMGVMGLMVVAPGLSMAGVLLPAAGAMELRRRLFLMCMPLMPLLTYTIAAGGLTYAQLTYDHLLGAGFVLAMLLAGERLREPRLARWDGLFALMMLVQAFMDCRGNNVTYSIRACNQIILNLALPYVVVSRAFVRSRSPNDLMLAVVMGGGILALIASFEAPRHWLLYDTMPQTTGADPEIGSGYVKQRGGLLRSRATFPESTGLSMLLGMDVVLLVALRRHLGSSIAFGAALAVLTTGMFFTLARICYIVVVVGLIAGLVQKRKWLALLGMAAAIPLCAGALLMLSHAFPILGASMGTGDDAAGSVDYRSELLTSGLKLMDDHWLIGQSMENIYAHLEHLRQGEGIIDLVNQPLTILMRSGIIGAALYYAILVAVLTALFLRGPRLEGHASAAATGCFAGLVGMMASLTTTSYGRNEASYVLLLAAGAGLVSRAQVVITRFQPARHASDSAP
ncbi:hypothetical protein FHW96_002615 [Novosphingobium sp. SG751A]|uniref:O-antigen ligase family protein n=1 Tax=Novosphingobium sp. SG751A TaxID=2587000 RepID=UPI001557B252|nr:O-antigen ligase family protein [Novosphingobium sp. SG751A]NOW46455.1 hypothetical protein [Novosphingobium sp. SG751A]